VAEALSSICLTDARHPAHHCNVPSSFFMSFFIFSHCFDALRSAATQALADGFGVD